MNLKIKSYFILILGIIITISSCKRDIALQEIVNKRVSESHLNFVPDSAGITPSYWCSWGTQNFAFDTTTLKYMIGLGDHSLPADHLTEEAVFNNPGWEKQFPENIKKDLFIVFDVGWDIQGGSNADRSKWILGTHELAIDKFPSCTGTPEERLKKLNNLVQKAGWKGAGLWIAAQSSMDSKGLNPSREELEVYFRERMKWAKNAGIMYWKVDYGCRGDLIFLQMLTRLASEEAPDLWVEHGRSGAPFNDAECPWDSKNFKNTGSFKIWDDGNALGMTHTLLEFSDVLRTYDVTAQLSIPTTLDRVAEILNTFTSKPAGKGIINCEDEPCIAAALGCATGIMRHPAFIEPEGFEYDPLRTKNQIDAITRTVRWQRMSPAFSAGANKTNLDSVRNNDYWKFLPGQSWAKWMDNKTVLQSAPARVSRGMQLPDVACDGMSPYVISSKFPNGNYAVATLLRTDSVKGFVSPLADVTLHCDNAAPTGVFGMYKSLTLMFGDGAKVNQVFAQDLAGNKAIEITDLIEKSNGSIKISGELLKLVGLSAATKGDVSELGMLLIFK